MKTLVGNGDSWLVRPLNHGYRTRLRWTESLSDQKRRERESYDQAAHTNLNDADIYRLLTLAGIAHAQPR